MRTKPRYAYLGPEGTFTEAALLQVSGPEMAELLPCTDVVTALDLVRTGQADRAVVPVENSIEGGVNATLDALATGTGLRIVGEMLVPVTFTLCARRGTSLSDIRRIATHPHAWAQCRRWVGQNLPPRGTAEPGDAVVHVPATSTAAAAALLAQGPQEFEAALCSQLSAVRYDLEVLAEEVADNPGAITRFIEVAAPGALPEPTGADKTTLTVHLPDNESGALLRMLEQFAARGVNLARIESRPIGDSLGRYLFSIDAEGHVAEERLREALIGLHRICPVVNFLGSYPRADGVRPALRPGTSDADFRAAHEWVEALSI